MKKKLAIVTGLILLVLLEVFAIFNVVKKNKGVKPVVVKETTVTAKKTNNAENSLIAGRIVEKSSIVEATKEAVDEEIAKKLAEEEQSKPSMERLLKTAMEPVGQTMYIWGGGWNEADDGPGIEAVTMGVSPRWAEFAAMQDASYNHNNTRYQIHDGLDCSGYIGWLVYNVMNTENNQEGYVMYACDMAREFANYGWGEYKTDQEFKPGDICSMSGHVWLCLGTCSDGSVLLAHASPPGVKISGTKLYGGYSSEATRLATEIMQNHFPDWYNRYPECGVDPGYMYNCVHMRWDTNVLRDEKHIQEMRGEEVASFLFDSH